MAIHVGIFDQIVSGGGVRLFTVKLLEQFSKLAGKKWRFHLMWPFFDSSNSYLPPVRFPHTTFERIDVGQVSGLRKRTLMKLCSTSNREKQPGGIPNFALKRVKANAEAVRTEEQQILRSGSGLGLQWLDHRVGKFDLLYVPYPYLTLPRASKWVRPPKPVVITLHDLSHEQTEAWGELTGPLRREMKEWTSLSDLVIFSSDFIQDQSRKLYGLPPTRSKRIYLAPPPRSKSKTKSGSVLGRYGLKKGYVFTLGWAANHKRIVTIIEGFAIFKRRSMTDIALVIAGPRTEEMPDGNLFGLEIGRELFALGYVRDDEIPYLYENSSLVVTASISEAGLNAMIFDAMRCGKSVICSHIPQFVERLGTDNSKALTFDPFSPQSLADAMARHFGNPDSAKLRRDNAKIFISSRTVTDVGRDYLGAFESVLH